MDRSALLLYCQRRNPDGNQAILTEGQTVTRMGDDLQKKLSVLTAMNQFSGRWAAQREAAQDEWACVVRQLLLAILPLLADQLYRIELLEPQLGDANLWED